MLPDRQAWAESFVDKDFYLRLDSYMRSIIETRLNDSTKIKFSPNYQVNFSAGGIEFPFDMTPREQDLLVYKKFTLDSFYYVDYIRKNTQGKIADIGCGSSVFKYFYDDIIGIDPGHPSADINEEFNQEFSEKYQNTFSAAIAINSLHYIPLTELKKQLNRFANCLVSGGLGYATFNIERMFSFDKSKTIKQDLSEYIKEQIDQSQIEVLSLDMFDINANGNNGLDGNIRVFFKV